MYGIIKKSTINIYLIINYKPFIYFCASNAKSCDTTLTHYPLAALNLPNLN